MRDRIAQHLNEVVSLTIMALMTLALIAGQAMVADGEQEADDQRRDYSVVRAHSPE